MGFLSSKKEAAIQAYCDAAEDEEISRHLLPGQNRGYLQRAAKAQKEAREAGATYDDMDNAMAKRRRR
ncbi:hypothetical protein [Streptomyces bugieae]|uniref:CopG family transcriptional regulator n=1 Tax=Streptomyces bugieae TaxID=3098223 RepID=A0ABU7NL01_9ACTN|nr:hypothetical protein [Streptomyces sp. DSM 41528]